MKKFTLEVHRDYNPGNLVHIAQLLRVEMEQEYDEKGEIIYPFILKEEEPKVLFSLNPAPIPGRHGYQTHLAIYTKDAPTKEKLEEIQYEFTKLLLDI